MDGRDGSSQWIKGLRLRLGLTQSELSERIGVTVVTVSRWENGQSRPNRLAVRALRNLESTVASSQSAGPSKVAEPGSAYATEVAAAIPDFMGDPEDVRLFVEGERLSAGHLFSPGFGTETALIDPLPHQIIAVYNHMLPQPRLRFLLADDAGAGKTIMAGLYVTEMLSRQLIRRVLVVPPAGLVGNWKRELRTLFSLHLREVGGADCRYENPFSGPGSDLVVVSIDTLSGGRALERLCEPGAPPYDLVIFDEAHKLSASRSSDGTYDTTERYRLAELLAGAEPLEQARDAHRLSWHPQHLLLLTATPHMGKEFAYYALWRLLEPNMLATQEAFNRLPSEEKSRHFIRRVKEEMVKLDGSRIYPTRNSDTAAYDLTPDEWELYEALTSYVTTHYNKAEFLNRSAARLAMSVLQRRAASSTLALLRSLERRINRLDDYIGRVAAQEISERDLNEQQRRLRVADVEDEKTGDEEDIVEDREERDVHEDEAMGATTATTLAELQAEKLHVEDLLALAHKVRDTGQESKFDRLYGVIQDTGFRNEKLLIFTEHRDTMDFIVQRLEALGYTGQVARIHGGMPWQEREAQMDAFRKTCRFMVATDAAGEGINLQFCWIMVNYDIPWNPARIEQRFGRIHRYKQRHDPVVLVNLVASKTREGRVLKTLLDKLETIRKELGSDKVFDVIGRQFQGASLTEIIMRAVVEDAADRESSHLEGSLTVEQVRATQEADAKLRSTGGDVASLLPALRVQREQDQLHNLLPGYVRSFIEKSAPRLGVRIAGDMNGQFRLAQLPIPLWEALAEATDNGPLPLTVNRPDPEEKVLFVRPGERFFDHYRAYFCQRVADSAARGGTFVDPYAAEPYLYHLALVTVVRRPDPEFPEAFRDAQVLDMRLMAVTQALGGEPRQCPVEHLMILRPATGVSPSAIPAIRDIEVALESARAYLTEAVAAPLAEDRRRRLTDAVGGREEFLRKGFDLQEAELLAQRSSLSDQARAGDQAARRRLEEVRQRQQGLGQREERDLAILRREPELVEVGEVTLLAHALVLPSSGPEDRERHDREVERIAMQVAWAYEESQRAQVFDVSTPEGAQAAGLKRWPGFDLLSRYPNGEHRCIEVKGRRAVGDVEVHENEWAKAANLREQYWLYVVYDCAATYPRLLRIQDPFMKLLVKTKGGVVVEHESVYHAAEQS